jgi:hypothetical protein
MSKKEVRISLVDGKRTLCKCPKCMTKHYTYMLWTGRGTPRKYCHNCDILVKYFIHDEIEYDIQNHIERLAW